MISEAASSGKIVLVIDTNNLDKKHRGFLFNLKEQGYIYLTEIDRLSDAVKDILSRNPTVKVLKDREQIKEKLSKIL
jgi:mitochondrial fission protein ELM1